MEQQTRRPDTASEDSAAPEGSLPRVAVMTMARDEGEMLRRWVAYYGREVGETNLLLLDDNSTDGSTDDLPCTVLRIPQGPYKIPWERVRKQLANGLARGLLACYDFVMFADTDEFLVPDPEKYAGLRAYLASAGDRRAIAPVAVNLLHATDLEPDLAQGAPVLEQRRFVKFVPGMCKPLIKRVSADWGVAFHSIKVPFEIDPDLLMVHLKYCDVSSAQRTAEERFRAHTKEGRGGLLSAWAVPPEDLAERVRKWARHPPGKPVELFDPGQQSLHKIIRIKENGHFRSRGGQLEAMDKNPLRQLPAKYRGLF